MKTDPICGMQVDETTARFKATRDGETFYFCSDHCRRKFLEQPIVAKDEPSHGCCGDRRLGYARDVIRHRHGDHQPSGGAKYFCPMCPGVESDEPGDCPKCGMALERNPAWLPAAKTIYTCPMHPEVQQDKPGDCPKCGMPLEPKEVATNVEEQSHEARDMGRRFWIGAVLSLPVLVLAMTHLLPGVDFSRWISPRANQWIQFVLSTPWCCGRVGHSLCGAGVRLYHAI